MINNFTGLGEQIISTAFAEEDPEPTKGTKPEIKEVGYHVCTYCSIIEEQNGIMDDCAEYHTDQEYDLWECVEDEQSQEQQCELGSQWSSAGNTGTPYLEDTFYSGSNFDCSDYETCPPDC